MVARDSQQLILTDWLRFDEQTSLHVSDTEAEEVEEDEDEDEGEQAAVETGKIVVHVALGKQVTFTLVITD